MKISKENLLYYNFIDCKTKNLLIDKKYNSELNNYLIDICLWKNDLLKK